MTPGSLILLILPQTWLWESISCVWFFINFLFLVSDLVIVVSTLMKKKTDPNQFSSYSYHAWLRELRAGLQSWKLEAGTGAETTEDRCLPAWSP